MIYYFSHIVNAHSVLNERNAISAEAGKLRTLYICKSIEKKITVVSLGNPSKKGFFKKRTEKINDNIDIIYLRAINYLHLKYIFYFFSIFLFIVKHIKKSDKVIMYNAMPHHTLPILIMKYFMKFELIFEIEELYSSYSYKGLKGKVFNYSEKLALKHADKYLVSNSNMQKFVDITKPCLVNRGYSSIDESNRLDQINNNTTQDSERPIILYSGRLDIEGGIEVFLEAIQYLRSKCEIVITGKGYLEEKVKNYTVENKLVHYNFAGFLPKRDFEILLRKASVCMNPIRIDHKFSGMSFPSKIFQYLEFGNKVISSNFKGLSELDEYLKENIVTYVSDNPIELAKTIDDTLKNKVFKENIMLVTNDFFEKQKNSLKEFMND